MRNSSLCACLYISRRAVFGWLFIVVGCNKYVNVGDILRERERIVCFWIGYIIELGFGQSFSDASHLMGGNAKAK